jgi:hypothetical protein
MFLSHPQISDAFGAVWDYRSLILFFFLAWRYTWRDRTLAPA